MRDAEITGPIPSDYGFGRKYIAICYCFNAKNQYGAYNGIETWSAFWKDGVIDVGVAYKTKCDTGRWQPFPELNGKG